MRNLEKKKKREKMGRSPCCDKEAVKKGAWTPEEDKILVDYINKNGHGTWRSLPKFAGLLRCGKSCRLRWTNYLRPDIKRGPFSPEEEKSIFQLHSMLGNKWAAIASHLPGRTDNEVKNFWNSHLKKRAKATLNQQSNQPSSLVLSNDVKLESPSTRHMVQCESARLEAEAQLSMDSLLLTISSSSAKTECDYFLRLWNSKVGESFREGMACQSPLSQVSSSTKCESPSGVMIHTDPARTLSSNEKQEEHTRCKGSEDLLAGSDSSKSYELDDCSGPKMQLLLDFPNGNGMEFLQEPIDDVSMYLQDPI